MASSDWPVSATIWAKPEAFAGSLPPAITSGRPPLSRNTTASSVSASTPRRAWRPRRAGAVGRPAGGGEHPARALGVQDVAVAGGRPRLVVGVEAGPVDEGVDRLPGRAGRGLAVLVPLGVVDQPGHGYADGDHGGHGEAGIQAPPPGGGLFGGQRHRGERYRRACADPQGGRSARARRRPDRRGRQPRVLPRAARRRRFDLIYIDPPFNTGRAQRRRTLYARSRRRGGERTGFGGRRYRTSSLRRSPTTTPSPTTSASSRRGSSRRAGCSPSTARCTSTSTTARPTTASCCSTRSSGASASSTS